MHLWVFGSVCYRSPSALFSWNNWIYDLYLNSLIVLVGASSFFFKDAIIYLKGGVTEGGRKRERKKEREREKICRELNPGTPMWDTEFLTGREITKLSVYPTT